jgi:hypothetical protein
MSMSALRLTCVGCHLLVAAAIGFLLFQAIGAGWALLLTLPLIVLLPGVYKLSLGQLRLTTIIIVPYLTVAVMETVANAQIRLLTGAILFGLLLELVCLIALIRAVQARPILQHSPDKGNR